MKGNPVWVGDSAPKSGAVYREGINASALSGNRLVASKGGFA